MYHIFKQKSPWEFHNFLSNFENNIPYIIDCSLTKNIQPPNSNLRKKARPFLGIFYQVVELIWSDNILLLFGSRTLNFKNRMSNSLTVNLVSLIHLPEMCYMSEKSLLSSCSLLFCLPKILYPFIPVYVAKSGPIFSKKRLDVIHQPNK